MGTNRWFVAGLVDGQRGVLGVPTQWLCLEEVGQGSRDAVSEWVPGRGAGAHNHGTPAQLYTELVVRAHHKSHCLSVICCMIQTCPLIKICWGRGGGPSPCSPIENSWQCGGTREGFFCHRPQTAAFPLFGGSVGAYIGIVAAPSQDVHIYESLRGLKIPTCVGFSAMVLLFLSIGRS